MDWGTLIGLSGIALALYQYFKTRSKTALVVDEAHYVVFQEGAWPRFAREHISVLYKNKVATRLIRTYVLAWNAGNKTLVYDETLKILSLRFPEGAEIFNVGIRSNDDEANNARAELDSSHVALYFDYLRAGESVVYFVDHAADQKAVVLVTREKVRNLLKRNRIEATAFLELAAIAIIPLFVLFSVFIGIIGLFLSSEWLRSSALMEKTADNQLVLSTYGLIALGSAALVLMIAITVFYQKYFGILSGWGAKFLSFKYGKSVGYYQRNVKGSITFPQSDVD
jgi:hypothetical protein